MKKRITIRNIKKDEFYQIPKVLLHSSRYEGLSPLSVLAYGILKDRLSLSHKNGWFQKNDAGEDEIYFIFTNEELMKVLGVKSNSTISRIKKELGKYNLLDQERQGLNKPNKLFLCEIDESFELDEILERESYPQVVSLDNKGRTLSGRPESVRQEVQKLYGSNTYFSKTDKRLDTLDTEIPTYPKKMNQNVNTKEDYMNEAFYKNNERVPEEISNMFKAFFGNDTKRSEKSYQTILRAKKKVEQEVGAVIWLEHDPETIQIVIQAFSLAIRKVEKTSNVSNPDGYVYTSVYNALSYHYQSYGHSPNPETPLFNWLEDEN